ncbi:hypothetical protein VTI28DRAFT_2693 [Corynascus sepedonium]
MPSSSHNREPIDELLSTAPVIKVGRSKPRSKHEERSEPHHSQDWIPLVECSLAPVRPLQAGNVQRMVGNLLPKAVSTSSVLQGTGFSSDHCVATLDPLAGAALVSSSRCEQERAWGCNRSRCAGAGRVPKAQRLMFPKRLHSPSHRICALSFPPFLTHSASQQLSTLLPNFRRQPYTLFISNASRTQGSINQSFFGSPN